MKRGQTISLIVIVALMLSLTACSNSNSDETTKSESPTTEAVTETKTVKESVSTTEPKSETEKTSEETTTESIATGGSFVTGSYEVELSPGAYYVGFHIPEGEYDMEVVSGLGTMSVSSGISSSMGSGTAIEYASTYSNAKLTNGDVLKLSQTLTLKVTSSQAIFSSMSSYENPAKEEAELAPGTYVVGQDVPAGIYDVSIVSGTANVNLDDYSFSAMLTDNEALAESSGASYKNLELLEGRTLQVSSGTVKLTPTPDITPIEP